MVLTGTRSRRPSYEVLARPLLSTYEKIYPVASRTPFLLPDQLDDGYGGGPLGRQPIAHCRARFLLDPHYWATRSRRAT